MAFPGARKSINKKALALLIAILTIAVAASAGMSSATYRIDRSSANSGSDTPTGGAAYRAFPHVFGGAATGQSFSGNYQINHGSIGGILRSGDQIYVDPLWTAQGDVDADPTVGVAGCNPAAVSLVYGVNAFNSITAGVVAVNSGGTVYVLNGTYQEENIAVTKPMTIVGYDESTSGCLGLSGQAGAIVEPATSIPGGKTLFNVASSDVTIRDLTLEGDTASFAAAYEADFGVYVLDATASIDNVTLRNLTVRNFGDHGAYFLAPNTAGYQVANCDFQILGDYVGGSVDGGAVLFGGASGSMTGGSVTMATNGVSILGGDTAAMAPLTGSGAIPEVDVTGVSFLSVGGGGSNGQGAIAYLNNAIGVANSNSLMGIHRGIQVGSMVTTGTVEVSENVVTGPAFVGLDINNLEAPTPVSPPSTVDATSNTLMGVMDAAAISVRYIGRDSVGSTAPANVNLTANRLSSIDTSALSTYGVFVSGVDTGFGQVFVADNAIVATPTLASGIGVSVHTTDQVFGTATDNEAVGVQLYGNTITGWPQGVSVISVDNGGLPGATVDVLVGGVSSNSITGGNFGIEVDGQAAAATITDNLAISNNSIGIAATGGSYADIRNNRIAGNIGMAVQADTDALVNLENNYIGVPSSPATGVYADNAGTVDMGGGLFGSAGGNTFDVADSSAAVQLVAFLPGTVRAEGNTWQSGGVTYNGAVAVDDMIFDGDLDNPLGEGATAGPLDFIPFNAGTLQSPITLDGAASRGLAGYGTTLFRALSDGVEAVATGGTVDVVTANYYSLRYDPDSIYQVLGTRIDRPMSLVGDAPGGPIVYPMGNDVGTSASVVVDGSALNLFEIQSDDVAMSNMVLDGDNPAIPGGASQNGADVNARNAVVIDHTIADGPDNLSFDNVAARNFYYKGIASNGSASDPSDALAVNNSRFDNISGQGDEAGAIALSTLTNTSITSNTIDLVGLGIDVTPTDATSTHTISYNALSNVANLGINANIISNAARFDISGNTLAMGPTANKAIAVESITATAQAIVSGNDVQSGSGILLAVRDVDPDSLILAQANDLISTSGLTIGVQVEATERVTTSTTGLQLVSNQIDNHTIGVDVIGGTAPTVNIGTVLRRNALDGNATGVSLVTGPGGAETEVLVGGDTIAETNAFTNSGTGVFVSGQFSEATVLNQYTPFDTQTYGVWAEGAAKVIVRASRFDNSTSAAIALTDNGTEMLIEKNRLAGDTNQVGVLIDNNAQASMGPGVPGNDVSSLYFAGAQSLGTNRFWNYTGVGGHFAIHNLSARDQNAENNDFGTVDLLTIEGVVEHQPDNGQGLVLFDPPMAPFTTIEDWAVLQRE
ncbi:right-handed parallel beta-helix repeat-containing protein [bacterium]|nr:right-handed parallel beta-helix repeat-containing protein [bacterium]